jgi:hypothetical protein
VQRARQLRRGRLVLVAADDECRDRDFGHTVALVGEPHGLGSDAISCRVDA